MTSPPPTAIATYLLCVLLAYLATGVGLGLFVPTAILGFNSSTSKLPFISLGIFLLVPPLVFIIGGFVFFRIIATGPQVAAAQGAWKRKFVLWSVVALAINYIFAIFLAGYYLKPLEGVISYCLENAPDW